MKTLLISLVFLLSLQNVNANVLIKNFEVSIKSTSAVISWDIDVVPYSVIANIEKSRDGITYYSISTFELSTTQHNGSSYIDKNLMAGTYYYRLHLSKPRYLPLVSKVITIKLNDPGNGNDFQVMNPVSENFQVRGKLSGKTIVIEIIGLNGTKTIKQERLCLNELLVFSTSSLNKGWYILKITDKGNNAPLLTRTVYKQ